MKIKPFLQGNSFWLNLFLLIILTQSQIAVGQSVSGAKRDFDKIAKAYRTGKLSFREYLDHANETTYHYMYEGVHFMIQKLTGLLNLYKEVACNKEGYSRDRKNYYVIFLKKASIFERPSKSIYYSKKENQKYIRNGEKDPLVEDSPKSQIYTEEELYDKVIDQYIEKKLYLETLSQLLRVRKVDIAPGMEVHTILSADAIVFYAKTGDSTALYQTAYLPGQLGDAIKYRSAGHRQHQFYNDFLSW